MEYEYILVQDMSGHWFMITRDKEKQWDEMCESGEFDNGEYPRWADNVESPQAICFQAWDYR